MPIPLPPWTRPAPLPGPILTPRLELRWWRDEDARALHEAVDGRRNALLPWLPWAKADHATEEAARAVIQRFSAGRADPDARDFVLAIFDRATDGLVGGTGLHRIVPEAHEAEIGYWIRGERHGEGLCTEATAGLVTAAFGDWGFRRLRICCAGGNRASQRVVEKLGIPLEGREREARWIDGRGWQDHLTYGVLAHEWDAAARRVRAD